MLYSVAHMLGGGGQSAGIRGQEDLQQACMVSTKWLQGYLAQQKRPPPRSLQKDYA